MKKCKYHCDYGDGEYCHYKGKGGCADYEKIKPWEKQPTVNEAIEALKANGWTECTYNGYTFAMVKNHLVSGEDS